MRFREIAGGLAASLLLGGAQVAGPVDLSQPWALPAAAGADTSVMMILYNEGDVEDDLIGATCAGTDGAALMVPTGESQPAQRVDAVKLGPRQTITFTPSGLHLVLFHLAQPAVLGHTLHCTATFRKSGERLFEASIRTQAPPVLPPT